MKVFCFFTQKFNQKYITASSPGLSQWTCGLNLPWKWMAGPVLSAIFNLSNRDWTISADSNHCVINCQFPQTLKLPELYLLTPTVGINVFDRKLGHEVTPHVSGLLLLLLLNQQYIENITGSVLNHVMWWWLGSHHVIDIQIVICLKEKEISLSLLHTGFTGDIYHILECGLQLSSYINTQCKFSKLL